MPNKSSRIPVGETVILACHLELAADCGWMHNDVQYHRTSGYSVSDEDLFMNRKKDCSLKICNFQESDGGKWLCWDKRKPRRVAMFHLEPGR